MLHRPRGLMDYRTVGKQPELTNLSTLALLRDEQHVLHQAGNNGFSVFFEDFVVLTDLFAHAQR
jgi:hypothetical protein